MLRVMVIGGGAREHTLVWKLVQSPRVGEVYVAPGNAGTASIAHNLNLRPTDIEALADTARALGIDLTVVGPEAPLAGGIVDLFQQGDIPIFGPAKAAAQIESSKVFSKGLLQRYGLPGAEGVVFSSFEGARDYVQHHRLPVVIKADGLTAGKGVTVAKSTEEALEALSEIMERRVFGSAGERVVIDECLVGREASLLAFTDGDTVVPMVPACDYKRVFEGDEGPNTGGMGGYSPPGFFTPGLIQRAEESILKPVVKAMSQEGNPYKGVLYAGLMVTAEGPKVLEFNARFGDPESQVTLPRLKTDLVDILQAAMSGSLDRVNIEWSEDACVGVVMASAGYPGSYQTGFPINGLDELDEDILVFHAGTRTGQEPGQIYTDGGRVLTVVARGKTIAEARDRVYLNLPRIRFEGGHYRRDIAAREVS
jgi:phosphoribosylamine--glycine ligase